MLSPETILQNRYRIIRQLGQGGMGTVYEALDVRVNAVVALKEANRATDEDSRREFEREARLLANLHHQSLPKVMDYFIEGDAEYLVMEYIPGYDLAELLKRRGAPFHLKAVLRWADDLLNMLEYLHGLKPPILHRDIKPANLKLTQREEIYLLDFGLAKGAVGKMTMTQASRSVRGYTPVYAPLEQIAGQGTDPRSDLYALAATLYHLLTNVPPVDAATRDEYLEQEKPDPLPLIGKLNPKVPPGVADVIHRAMAIRRKSRPESAAEMRRALRSAEDEAGRSEESPVSKIAAESVQLDGKESSNFSAPTVPTVGATKTDLAGARSTQESATTNARDVKIKNVAPLSLSKGATPQWGLNVFVEPPPYQTGTVRRNSHRTLIVVSILLIALSVVAILVLRNVRRNRRLALMNREATPQPTMTPVPLQGAPSYSENLNGVTLEMVLIPGGTFQMGSPDGGEYKERPQHQVTVPTFYMGKYEVTQAQWREVIGVVASSFKGGNLPVENVSWEDAVAFCKRLSAMTGREYRLPSEAEWEYACRAGTTTAFAFGDSLSPEQANFDGRSPYGAAPQGEFRQRTTPVGSFASNGFGLYDMHGNVSEWCADMFHITYKGAPTDGSAWVSGEHPRQRTRRGGSWRDAATELRCAARGLSSHDSRAYIRGFRVVAVAR